MKGVFVPFLLLALNMCPLCDRKEVASLMAVPAVFRAVVSARLGGASFKREWRESCK